MKLFFSETSNFAEDTELKGKTRQIIAKNCMKTCMDELMLKITSLVKKNMKCNIKNKK